VARLTRSIEDARGDPRNSKPRQDYRPNAGGGDVERSAREGAWARLGERDLTGRGGGGLPVSSTFAADRRSLINHVAEEEGGGKNREEGEVSWSNFIRTVSSPTTLRKVQDEGKQLEPKTL